MANTLGSPGGHGATERGLLPAADSTATVLGRKSNGDPPTRLGRFGRMFPGLPGAAFFISDIESLAAAMSAEDEGEATPETVPDSEENLGLPAGYTYFGQFVDHDLTLDAVSLSMQKEDLNLVENFRTPALDLDSLYGRGPADQPYLFGRDGDFLMSDRSLSAGPGGPELTKDLPRFRGRALIGDKRNDENVIVSQLHGLFMRFHNRLLQSGRASEFDVARRLVQWHYQWLVLFDYLPRIVGRDLVDAILPFDTTLGAPRPPDLRLYRWQAFPYMPIEFAGAAYRFGHSMVRPIYRLNSSNAVGNGGRLEIFKPPVNGEGLNGFREFPSTLGIDWDLFFEMNGRKLGPDTAVGAGRIQPAYKIDTSLVFPLQRLPEFSDNAGNANPATAVNALAERNLKRGLMLQLPSGQAVARRMIELGVPGITVLRDEQLQIGRANDEDFDLDAPIAGQDLRHTMIGSAPLWFYVLAEARHQWRQDALLRLAAAGNPTGDTRSEIINETPTRLGPVGGRIVAETLIGLVAGDETSFLNAPQGFEPLLGNTGVASRFERFQVGDLISWVISG